ARRDLAHRQRGRGRPLRCADHPAHAEGHDARRTQDRRRGQPRGRYDDPLRGAARRGAVVDVSDASNPLNYFDAESFDISAMASCTVVMNCAGKMIVEFFSTDISAIV